MAYVMPQIAVHRVLQEGFDILRNNIDVLDDIFAYYNHEAMAASYGQAYIDQIKTWFTNTKIPIVQAWSMNMQKCPQIGIQLAQESEDESKAALGDHWGDGETSAVGVGVFSVTLDIMLFGTKNSDEVLWLYYMTNYVLFKSKRRAEDLGMQLHTFSASDYSRDMPRMPENIWVRTIKFRATVENHWDAEPYINADQVEVDLFAQSTSEDGSMVQLD